MAAESLSAAGRTMTGALVGDEGTGKSHCPRTPVPCVHTGVRMPVSRMAIIKTATVLALAAGLWAGVNASRSARIKLDLIEGGQAPRGSRIAFSAAELNAWVVEEAALHAPQGARNPRIVLGTGIATGYVDIDFLKLRQAATGEAPGWLLKNLFSGERPVKVVARFQSRAGRARVDVDSVEVSGIPIEGRALDFALEAFVRPSFPYATVSQWFDMQYGVERFAVSPAGVAVFIRR
jgi:hypothetical protein